MSAARKINDKIIHSAIGFGKLFVGMRAVIAAAAFAATLCACSGNELNKDSESGQPIKDSEPQNSIAASPANPDNRTALSETLIKYSDRSSTHLPGGLSGQCMDAAAQDMDMDGDIDLVLAMEFSTNILLLNDGAGVFSKAQGFPQTGRDSEDIAIADYDNDGDLDIVFVSEDDEVNEMFLNSGDGSYSDVSARLPLTGVSNAVVTTDLNGDAMPDLIIGNVGPQGILINDGKGGFIDETASRIGLASYRVQDLALADIDNDGDLDLLTADENQNRIFINDGSGHFKDETAPRLAVFSDETREVILADVDNDGDLDIYYANVSFIFDFPNRNRLLLNDGKGRFADVSSARLPGSGNGNNFTASFVELSGDAFIDLIVPHAQVYGAVAGLYETLINDGAGNFVRVNLTPQLPEGNGFDIANADFNGDGLLDLFLCNRAAGGPGTARSGGRDSLLLQERRSAAAGRVATD